MHFHLHDNLSSPDCPIPSLVPESPNAVATPEEARAFELWLRETWTAKEKRLVSFFENQSFPEAKEGVEVFALRQM